MRFVKELDLWDDKDLSNLSKLNVENQGLKKTWISSYISYEKDTEKIQKKPWNSADLMSAGNTRERKQFWRFLTVHWQILLKS